MITARDAIPVLAVTVLGLASAVFAASPASALPQAEVAEPRGLRLLVEAVGDRRVVEGRLSGGFGWGPWVEDRVGGSTAGGADVELAIALAPVVAVIEDEAAEHRSTETLHTLGLLRLVQQRWDEAVAALEEAAAGAPEGAGRAAIVSDLAAAYLARGQAEGRPAEWLEALTTAEKAVRLDPTSAGSRFNRALACSRLRLPRASRSAWDGYLHLDASSPWAAEAQRHLQALAAPTFADRWGRLREPLIAAALDQDGATTREIVAELPLFTRSFGENIALPAWGAALAAGDGEEAGRQLAVARAIGDALVGLDLDHSVAEAVASIEEAQGEPGSGRLGDLARGHAAYGEGYRIEKGMTEGSACEAYRQARDGLSSARSAFAPWAAFSEVLACRYQSDNEGAHQALSALAAEVSPERDPALAGRIDWMLLLTEMRRGRFEASYRHGLRAFELLRRAGDVDAASVDVRLAFIAQVLGLEGEAWDHRLRALEGFAGFGHLAGLHGALDEIAGLLLDQGRADGAEALVEELVANAGELTPAHRAYAYGERARLGALRGDVPAAGRDLAMAEAEAAQLPPGDVRRRVEEDLAFTRGRIEVATDPQAAVGTLTGSLEGYGTTGDLLQAPRLHLLRARAQLALGLPVEAERDFEEAFRQVEARRAHSASERHRVSFFETFQETTDELIAFFAEERRDPARAFAYAESARGRALLDRVRRFGPSGGSLPALDAGYPTGVSLADLVSELPAELALIQYAVLPEQVLAWVCRRGSCRMRSLPQPAAALEARVLRFYAAMERNAGEAELRGPAERLFAELIAPLAEDLGDAEGLVVVPDRFLHLLPFAALQDGEAREYLVERWSLRVTPSASVFLSALRRVRPVPERRGVLAIADPELVAEDSAELGALPLAAEEARRVAALYPRRELLLGAQASKARLFEDVERFPVLHVASHARHRPETPLMSDLPLSDGGVPGAGTLYAHELYGRDWSGVEVVVLSACRTAGSVTGSGREGPAGLLRAFLAAGVPRVVAAGWDVPDRATLELMVRFHERLAAGEDPAKALQAAQVEMLRHEEERFRSPAVWANFQLYGP